MKLIQRLVNPLPGSGPRDSYGIIGSDSDLFVMALLQDKFSDLWILSEAEVAAGSGNIMEGFTTAALSGIWGAVPKVCLLNSYIASPKSLMAII